MIRDILPRFRGYMIPIIRPLEKNISKVFVSKLLLLPRQNQIYTRSQYMKFERYIIEQLCFILQFVQPKTLP